MKYYTELFNNYYKKFDDSEYWIKYKYDHTYRVVEYTKKIAQSLNLSKEDIELSQLCGLFHDISRFKQYTEYKTFTDSKSFDHGDMGYTILKELGIDNDIILISTKIHNKYQVDESLDDRTKLFCNIVRDADKLDILFDTGKENNDELLELSDKVLESYKNHRMVPNELVNNNTVSILRTLAFIFDLKFKKSFEIVKQSNIVNNKFDIILNKFDDNRIKEMKDILIKYINERIDKDVRY